MFFGFSMKKSLACKELPLFYKGYNKVTVETVFYFSLAKK